MNFWVYSHDILIIYPLHSMIFHYHYYYYPLIISYYLLLPLWTYPYSHYHSHYSQMYLHFARIFQYFYHQSSAIPMAMDPHFFTSQEWGIPPCVVPPLISPWRDRTRTSAKRWWVEPTWFQARSGRERWRNVSIWADLICISIYIYIYYIYTHIIYILYIYTWLMFDNYGLWLVNG